MKATATIETWEGQPEEKRVTNLARNLRDELMQLWLASERQDSRPKRGRPKQAGTGRSKVVLSLQPCQDVQRRTGAEILGRSSSGPYSAHRCQGQAVRRNSQPELGQTMRSSAGISPRHTPRAQSLFVRCATLARSVAWLRGEHEAPQAHHARVNQGNKPRVKIYRDQAAWCPYCQKCGCK